MYLESVSNGMATVRLSPDECVFLYQSCEAATANLIGLEEEAHQSQIETIGSLFKGAAIAGFAQWGMSAVDLHQSDATMKRAKLAA